MEDLDFSSVQKLNEADRLLREYQPSGAVTVIKELVKTVPAHPYFQYLLGIARMKCGRLLLAKEAMEKANELEGNNAEFMRSFGWLNVMLGYVEEGRKHLRRSIDRELTKAESYLDLAMSYFHYFEFEEGRKWLTIARSLAPDDPYTVECGKIANAMEKDFSKYSPAKLQKMRAEKLDSRTQKEFRLSMLEDFLGQHQTLTGDEVEEVTEEFRLNNFKGRIVFASEGADSKLFDTNCDLCLLSNSDRHSHRMKNGEGMQHEKKGGRKKVQ